MNPDRLILASARESANLEELAKHGSPILGACGTAGPSIARQIIEGGGRAEIPLNLVRMATDTQDGIEAIFDNFILEEKDSGKPLVHSLISSQS